MNILRVIMIGDVVGEPGIEALETRLPGLIAEHTPALVTVNGENAAGGFGMTEETLKRILAAGADVVTSGNHVWEKREFLPVMNLESRILRPANYPAGAAGRGWIALEKAGVPWLVINLQGRELMQPIDCPFRAFDGILSSRADVVSELHPLFTPDSAALPIESNTSPFVLVDFHAESAREKEALGLYLDGRASIVAGTHTHVQTADERILPKGTAYITDLGMTGARHSIIGMNPKICLDRARTQVAFRMECAQGEAGIQGIIVELDGNTKKALSIQRLGFDY
jgi:calcineurin-like phosphoesterase